MGVGLTWRVVAAAEAGTSHLMHSRPCEDRCRARVECTASGVPVLSVFVADGAGSASFGAAGAELAVEAGGRFLSACLQRPDFQLDEGLPGALLDKIRGRIEAAAASDACMPSDFACTFLAVVSTPAAALVMQIGDGGVVLDTGHGLELAISPMSGEYANTTHFVTDDDAPCRMQYRMYRYPALRVAAFSDGMQRLALDMATGTPHVPLFARLFDVIAAASPAQTDQLQPALVRLLTSAGVNERTDDDKSLALAVLLP